MIEGVILLLIACLLIFVSWRTRRRHRQLRMGGLSAEGIVLDFENKDGYRYPVVRYRTAGNEWITQTSSVSYMYGLLKKGQQVTIIYNPHQPSEFMIDLKWTTITPVLLMVMAALMMGIAALLLSGSIQTD